MKKLVKPEDICETLGVCRRTLSRWEDQGLIRSIKVNARVFRYDPEDVEAMILTLKREAA
jgi:predicted site-specific integrase-resolvase